MQSTSGHSQQIDELESSFEIINIEDVLEKDQLITNAICGRWRQISSESVSDYFSKEPMSVADMLAWKHGEVTYTVHENMFYSHTEHSTRRYSASTALIGEVVDDGVNKVVVRVENNKLNTTCTSSKDGSVKWTVQRSVVDGRLVIVNWTRGSTCKRIYERIED